jgi:hypothetical protein
MDERIVKVLGFTYAKKRESQYAPGTFIVEHAFANRGDTIDFDSLDSIDKERADQHDVFYSKEEAKRIQDGLPPTSAAGPDQEEIVLGPDSSVDDLAEWIKDDGPTVDEVLELADTPEMAQKLLEAENKATGNEPRVGLVKGLEQVIGQA